MKKLKSINLLICLTLVLTFFLNITSCERAEQPDVQKISKETTLEASSTADFSEIIRLEDEIEAEQTNTIADINDWEKLGLSPEDSRYSYIYAFLNKDTETLEELSGLSWVGTTGAYDIYKTLEFGAYTISNIEYVILNINIVSSGVEYLSAGDYSFYVADGVYAMDFINLADNDGYGTTAAQTPAQEAFNRWLGSCNYIFYDYGSLSGDLLERYTHDILEYILGSFPEPDGGWTLDKVQEYAKKYLDIDNFMPSDNSLGADGKTYFVGAHGGDLWFYKFLDETTENGITTLRIQWFADTAKTVKSHTIEYTMQVIDGGYKFIGSKVVYESPYKPWHMGV